MKIALFKKSPHAKTKMAPQNPLSELPMPLPKHPAQISPVRMEPLEPPAVLYPLYCDELFINPIPDKLT